MDNKYTNPITELRSKIKEWTEKIKNYDYNKKSLDKTHSDQKPKQ